MQSTKIFKKRILLPAVALLISTNVNAFWFTGGPVINGLTLSEHITKNANAIESRVMELADFEAMRKLMVEQAKATYKSLQGTDTAKVKAEQQLETFKMNHRIALENAPTEIPGCDASGDDDSDLESGMAAVGNFRMSFCDDDDPVIVAKKKRALRDLNTLSDSSALGVSDRIGAIGKDQLSKDSVMAKKLAENIKNVQERISGVKSTIKSKQGSSATEKSVMKELFSVLGGGINVHDIKTDFMENVNSVDPSDIIRSDHNSDDDEGFNSTSEMYTRAISLIHPNYIAVDESEYNEALDYIIYLTNARDQKKKMHANSFVGELKRKSQKTKRNIPYLIMKNQLDDKLSVDPRSPSKVSELTMTGEYYRGKDYVTEISSSETLPYQVTRKKALAKSFQAFAELEKYKKMLDKEKLLAVILADLI